MSKIKYTVGMVLDGRKIAQEILDDIRTEVKKLNFQPVFCDVLVGSDPASVQYVNMKAQIAEQYGFKFFQANFAKDITTDQLVDEIKKLNLVPHMCGLIVQLPLPPQIDKQAVLDAIDPKIDVDCIGEINTELFYSGKPYMILPTAAAVMEVLSRLNIDLSKLKILVLGQGQLVGKPVAFLLRQFGGEVSVADINTANTEELMKAADVIISATGQPGLITKEKIRPGAIVIDAGTSEADSGIVGDVDFESVKEVASYISPVPGGVGPVTVAMLLSNVLKVARL